MKVVISGGSYKFHLSPLAAEMANEDNLVAFITAGWPKGWQKKMAELFPTSAGWKRFLDRYESIPDSLVCSIPSSELVFKIADIILRKHSQHWQQKLQKIGFYLYINKAAKEVKSNKPNIYHYRNCYGGRSVGVAKRNGAIALCDHSIAHPICLDWMEKNKGAWPDLNKSNEIRSKTLPLYKMMENDLALADYVIVNSDFVKQTCVYMGMDPERIYVVYLGIDNSFFDALASSTETVSSISKRSLLYAGGWQRRKGIQTVIDGLNLLDDNWNLEIAGGVEQESVEVPGMNTFLEKGNVKRYGILPRQKLAALMKRHRIFIFPSYCEGSARVVFEAMAAGCFVITTPNSGSIVEDRVHGRVIKAGDAVALKIAIQEAFDNPVWVDEIGLRNADLISKYYRQKEYGVRVTKVYDEIISYRRGKV